MYMTKVSYQEERKPLFKTTYFWWKMRDRRSKYFFPLAAALLNLRLLTQIGVYDGGNSFHGLQEDGR